MTDAELPQLGLADVQRLAKTRPGAIEEARLAGQLDQLLAGNDPNPPVVTPPGPDQLTREQVAELAKKEPGAVVKAWQEGRLRHIGG